MGKDAKSVLAGSIKTYTCECGNILIKRIWSFKSGQEAIVDKILKCKLIGVDECDDCDYAIATIVKCLECGEYKVIK